MSKKYLIGALAVLSICFADVGRTQEVLIPIDEAGRIDLIDAKLEQKLGLFTEYSHFQSARLFQIADSLFVLEIYHQPGERLVKVRLSYTKEEARDLQRKVTERIEQENVRVILDQKERTKLVLGMMALSLTYYGWAVPIALDVNEGKSAVGLYLLTSGAGFYLPLSMTRNIPVTDAATVLSLYGGTRGLAHGMTLAYLLDKDPSDRGLVASGMLVSIAETFAGFHLANRSGMSAGTSETIGIGGDFGLGLGLGAAHLSGFFDNDEGQAAAGTVLLGSGLGLLAGRLLADNQPYTRGDAYVLSATGYLGAYIPLAVVDLSGTDNDRTYTAASMLGAVVGLGVGHRLLQGKDFTTGQGTMIRISELAGGLLGLGAAYLLSSENADNSNLLLASSSIGAFGGFWLAYRSYARDAVTNGQGSSLHIDLRPEGLFALALGEKKSASRKMSSSLLRISLRF